MSDKASPKIKVKKTNKDTMQKKDAQREISLQEGPIERALKLSSDQVIAMAIRELIKKDELN